MQREAAVHGLAPWRLLPEDVVVLHAVVAAEVVGRHAAIDVVRGVDVHAAVEHMRGRISGVQPTHQWRRQRAGREAREFRAIDFTGHGGLALRAAARGQLTLDAYLGGLVDLVEEQQRTAEQERNRSVHADRELDAMHCAR